MKLNQCLYLYCSQELEAYKNQMDFTDGNCVSSEDSNVYAGLDVDHFKPVTKVHVVKYIVFPITPGEIPGMEIGWSFSAMGIALSQVVTTVSVGRIKTTPPTN